MVHPKVSVMKEQTIKLSGTTANDFLNRIIVDCLKLAFRLIDALKELIYFHKLADNKYFLFHIRI